VRAQSVVHRTLNGFGVALGLLPLAILLLFYAYVVRTRLRVGYWPYVYHPESWSQGFTLHYAILRPWFLVFPLGLVPVLVGVYDAAIWAVSRAFPRFPFIVLGISAITLYACLYADPGRFIDWFLD
jgi:hypothetical protein